MVRFHKHYRLNENDLDAIQQKMHLVKPILKVSVSRQSRSLAHQRVDIETFPLRDLTFTVTRQLHCN